MQSMTSLKKKADDSIVVKEPGTKFEQIGAY